MKRITTLLLGGALAFGGLSAVAAPANAAVYGQPGNVNCEIIRSVKTAPYERRVTFQCDYRTSAGIIIKDAVTYSKIKRSYTR